MPASDFRSPLQTLNRLEACWGVRFVLILCSLAAAHAQQPSQADLSRLDVEDLLNIKVSSVSKREQKLSQTAAAVFVVQQEDIRRSGADSIPELLRMVPGLEVAQINANSWAITARGFNGQLSNKLLVLIDGRTVYDPSFAGVYWDVQDTLLQDIDRIEVIRGPGATIWGSNAVNGVINITTKAAKYTQGGVMTINAGTGERDGSVRYGGKIGEGVSYRVFGKYMDRSDSDGIRALGLGDGSRFDRGGFRVDWAASNRDSATVEGDYYSGGINNPIVGAATPAGAVPAFTSTAEAGGGDVLARWNHTFHGGSQLSVQVYADRLSQNDPMAPDLRTTVDFDLRDHMTQGRHEIVWGSGYRRNMDRLSGSPNIHFTPRNFQSSIANGFVQDQMTLVEDKLWFTAGVKLEHNEYTGVEVEPSASLMWAPDGRNSFWLSGSQASRIPARFDTDIAYGSSNVLLPGGVPALMSASGNPKFQSERLAAFEGGYRVQAAKGLWFDLTAFRNHYSHLRTLEVGTPEFVTQAPAPYLLIPLTYGNKMFGETYGAESGAEWQAAGFWKLSANYTWFLPSLRLDPSSTDTSVLRENQGNTPRNQFQFQSRLNLPHSFEWDVTFYRVGCLATGSIPAYNRLDARLGWRASSHFDVSIGGRNLLVPRHLEFNEQEQESLSTPIERSLYCRFTWHF